MNRNLSRFLSLSVNLLVTMKTLLFSNLHSFHISMRVQPFLTPLNTAVFKTLLIRRIYDSVNHLFFPKLPEMFDRVLNTPLYLLVYLFIFYLFIYLFICLFIYFHLIQYLNSIAPSYKTNLHRALIKHGYTKIIEYH